MHLMSLNVKDVIEIGLPIFHVELHYFGCNISSKNFISFSFRVFSPLRMEEYNYIAILEVGIWNGTLALLTEVEPLNKKKITFSQ